VQHGGLVEVIKKKLWPQIIKGLPLPTLFTCACAAFTFQTELVSFRKNFLFNLRAGLKSVYI
jgi:hypothetical protein